MNEKNITHADVKYLPSKKQKQKEKIKEQRIYSNVKTSASHSNQTKITRPRSSKEKASSVPFTWCLILGILCFFLLLTTGILGFMVFQAHQKCQTQKSPLDCRIKEDNSTFKNLTPKKEPLNTGNKSRTCDYKWSCGRNSCYYFSDELKNFEDSKKICKEMDSTLVKIDDEKELKFIQSQLQSLSWIGLYLKGISSQWSWEDGSQPLDEINFEESKKGNCARMTTEGKIVTSECYKSSHYICEKKIGCLLT
ncbi:natural killer cells antigen CD94-like [Saccopteryx bilineata]|uniref:natural killer cells antigen CD94-like n=1 Tax=Saccopteryx bilineata TaxID=59482 RepID=UPI00338F5013